MIDACNNDRDSGMACLLENAILNLTSGSEDPEYPVTNVLDDHPKKSWIGTSLGEDTFSFSTITPVNSFVLFNTNVESIVVTITDPNAIEWEDDVVWEAGVSWDNVPLLDGGVYTTFQQGKTRTLWVDFTKINYAVNFDIRLITSKPERIEVGIARCGERVDLNRSPQYGLSEGLVDFSVVSELSNGAKYVKQRDIVRTFSGRVFVDREPTFYDFLYSIARELGQKPAAWKTTSKDLTNWSLFGSLNGMPSGSHDSLEYSIINFNLQEVL